MKIKGIVSRVSGNFPFEVTVGAYVFKSGFQFDVGMSVDLDVENGEFSYLSQSGFIHCTPNGFATYPVTDDEVKRILEGTYSIYLSSLPWFAVRAIRSGKKVAWENVERFYRYYYSCEFDPVKKVLTTNWTLNRLSV